MARMSDTYWTTHRSGKRDAKSSRRPTATVIARLAAESLELDRPQLANTNQCFFYAHHVGKVCSPQLLKEDMPQEGLRQGVIFGLVALGAAP